MTRNTFCFRSGIDSLASEPKSLWTGLLPGTLLLILLLLSNSHIAFAQGTGTISGYVRDNSGATIPGAAVTAVMTQQQTTRTQQSDAQGFYQFVALPAGTYTLTFEYKGFKREVHSGIELTVSQNVRADAQLSVGAVQTQVNVSSTVPLVDTTSNTISGLIDDRRVVDLPLNGRNVMSLAELIPGVTNVSAPQTQGDARGGPQMDVNGSLPNATVYTFDGAVFNNPSRNTGINLPPPDAIAQFRILTSNFSADTVITQVPRLKLRRGLERNASTGRLGSSCGMRSSTRKILCRDCSGRGAKPVRRCCRGPHYQTQGVRVWFLSRIDEPSGDDTYRGRCSQRSGKERGFHWKQCNPGKPN